MMNHQKSDQIAQIKMKGELDKNKEVRFVEILEDNKVKKQKKQKIFELNQIRN